MSSNHEVVEPTAEVNEPANEVNEPIKYSGPVEHSDASNTTEGGGVAASLYSEDGKDWGDEPTPIPSPTKELKNLADKVSELGGEMKTMNDIMTLIISKLDGVVAQNAQYQTQLQNERLHQEPKYADIVKDGVAPPQVVEKPSPPEEPYPPEEPSIDNIVAEFCGVFGRSIPGKVSDLIDKQRAVLQRFFTTTSHDNGVYYSVKEPSQGILNSKTLIIKGVMESPNSFYSRKCIINILQFMYGVFHYKFDIGRLDKEILIGGFIKSGVIERGEDSSFKFTDLGHKCGTDILEQFNC